MAEGAFRWVSKLKRGAERPLGVFHTGTIRFVDDEHVRDFQDPRFDGLDLIAQAWGFHDERCMRQSGNIHFTLPCTHCFDNNDLISSGIEDLYHGGRLLSNSAQCAARSHRTDKNSFISGKITHPNPVTQHGTACKWT